MKWGNVSNVLLKFYFINNQYKRIAPLFLFTHYRISVFKDYKVL